MLNWELGLTELIGLGLTEDRQTEIGTNRTFLKFAILKGK